MVDRGKVLVATPHNRDLTPEFVISTFGAIRALEGLGYKCELRLREGCLIHKQRNDFADDVVEEGYDYLFFIDSDMAFNPEDAFALFGLDKDIVGGIYYQRVAPCNSVVFRAKKGGNPEDVLIMNSFSDMPFECDAIATGFMLIKAHVLKHMLHEDVIQEYGFPFNFRTRRDQKQEGEDIAFCYRAKQLGYQIWAVPNLKLGHLGTKVYSRSDHDMRWGMYTNNIDGWMSARELNWLYNQARNRTTIVEIGSWKGRSTHALLSGTNGNVYAVDMWYGSKPEADKEKYDIFNDFMANCGKFNNLKVMRMLSQDAVKKFKDKSVDMVFIDGSHEYEDVKADIEAWTPKCKRLICGHDYSKSWPGVVRAVDELIPEFGLCDSIWYKEIK